MYYLEYEEIKRKYQKVQDKYNKLLDKYENVFNITQPKSTDYSKEKTNGGEFENSFDTYLIEEEKGKIKRNLRQTLELLNRRKTLFEQKKEELKNSTNVYDKVYYYRVILNKTATQISYLIPCDRKTTYNYMHSIEKVMWKKGYNDFYLIPKHFHKIPQKRSYNGSVKS